MRSLDPRKTMAELSYAIIIIMENGYKASFDADALSSCCTRTRTLINFCLLLVVVLV